MLGTPQNVKSKCSLIVYSHLPMEYICLLYIYLYNILHAKDFHKQEAGMTARVLLLWCIMFLHLSKACIYTVWTGPNSLRIAKTDAKILKEDNKTLR